MAITKFATKAQLVTAFLSRLVNSEGYERCRLSAKMDAWVKAGEITDKDLEAAGKVADVKAELAENATKYAEVESVKVAGSVISATAATAGGK